MAANLPALPKRSLASIVLAVTLGSVAVGAVGAYVLLSQRIVDPVVAPWAAPIVTASTGRPTALRRWRLRPAHPFPQPPPPPRPRPPASCQVRARHHRRPS